MRKENDYVNLVKGIGKFYNVYNDDAIIISYLMGYKVRENKTCGFPDNALNEVINKLEDKKISYIVTKMGNIDIEKNYKKINQYSSFLIEARKSHVIVARLDDMVDKINEMPFDKIEKIIKTIEKMVYETE